MPDFSFTIPANAVETGVPAAPEKITVDRGFQRQAQHRVLTANFGDGYEQRVRDGINTKNETFNGINCIATGWGQMQMKGPLQDSLRQVELKVVDNQHCSVRFLFLLLLLFIEN